MPGTGAGRSSSISPSPWRRCRSARRRPIASCSSWSTRRSFILPALKRPDDAVRLQLPPRQALLAGDTDVLVVGGGPAGLGAAVAAADAGARVVLAERYGFLGGHPTAALVTPLARCHPQPPPPGRKETPSQSASGPTPLLPTDPGPGERVVAGVLR